MQEDDEINRDSWQVGDETSGISQGEMEEFERQADRSW
jgi:hypothetical protein